MVILSFAKSQVLQGGKKCGRAEGGKVVSLSSLARIGEGGGSVEVVSGKIYGAITQSSQRDDVDAIHLCTTDGRVCKC